MLACSAFGHQAKEGTIGSLLKGDTVSAAVEHAINAPEYVLTHPINMPIAPNDKQKSFVFLSLRDAIYLSLRYNPDLQSDELDRILSRYQLRLKENEFELQYALSGGGNRSWPNAIAINDTSLTNANISAEVKLNNHQGGTMSVSTDNQLNGNEYQPSLTVSYKQPLLRGAGRAVTDIGLYDQRDSDQQSHLLLKQSVIDKVTAVLEAYRALIQQNNSLHIQKQSLRDAIKTFKENEIRIASGRLAPSVNTQQAFQISRIKTDLEGQENARLLSSQSLLTTIGLDPKMNISVPVNVSLNKLTIPDEQQSLDYAFKHNTAYRVALIEAKKTYRAYIQAKNQQLWQLDLSLSSRIGQQNGITNTPGTSFFNGKNMEQRVSLDFSVPIRDLNRKQQLIAAKLALERTHVQLEAMRRQLRTDILNTIRSIRTQVHMFELSKNQLALAKKAYQLELKKQEAGIASSLDVTNSQNQLISARNNMTSVKITYLNLMSSLAQKLATTLDVWHLNIGFLK